ncbi:DUF4190 domain-containing protein [Cellulomonas sp. ATA003]|uniref:DUF4190 domain-containing protein n=1 Tax=Cellulomonas sp. ATA003 TaxID=3073064 RepID=UPI002873A26E|nr:DUF4190 domain-containing protein [Cellulomonas sp. ATA003]WNB86858.1 DUF4190 domain-containing protein [Cellulomonas sp. ATA003]
MWALVLGLVGFFLCGPIAAIPAIILGSKSRTAAANGEANNGGMGLAGVVLGWVTIALWIIGIVLFFAVFGGFAGYVEFIESNSGTTTTF